MIMTPLGGLVGSGVPSLAVATGATAAGMAAIGVGILLVGALVILLGRRGRRS
jgi:hypothetical protein